jgi:hypothetical protein
VFTLCEADVAVFLMVTVAFGTAALEASVILPVMDAVAPCPNNRTGPTAAKVETKIATDRTARFARLLMAHPFSYTRVLCAAARLVDDTIGRNNITCA